MSAVLWPSIPAQTSLFFWCTDNDVGLDERQVVEDHHRRTSSRNRHSTCEGRDFEETLTLATEVNKNKKLDLQRGGFDLDRFQKPETYRSGEQQNKHNFEKMCFLCSLQTSRRWQSAVTVEDLCLNWSSSEWRSWPSVLLAGKVMVEAQEWQIESSHELNSEKVDSESRKVTVLFQCFRFLWFTLAICNLH